MVAQVKTLKEGTSLVLEGRKLTRILSIGDALSFLSEIIQSVSHFVPSEFSKTGISFCR